MLNRPDVAAATLAAEGGLCDLSDVALMKRIGCAADWLEALCAEQIHLARGFAGNDRALAEEVGEVLLAAGLLAEKPSVGQRHVFLNPRRAREIHALIERGEVPADVKLPG